MVPQELVFDPFFTVRETLRIQSGYFGLRNNDDWIDEVMDNLDLTDKADTNMRALSGGMKRRVLVAQALVHKPPVIVLDEPTAGVDVELRQTLWNFISRLNREGHTIVLTTHYLEEAEALCDRIAMLKPGRSRRARHARRRCCKRFAGMQLLVALQARRAACRTAFSLEVDPHAMSRHAAPAAAVETTTKSSRFSANAARLAARSMKSTVRKADLEDVFRADHGRSPKWSSGLS